MSGRASWGMLIALLLAQLILATAQVPDREVQGSLLEGLFLRVTAPVARAVDGGRTLARRAGVALTDRRTLRAQNRRLERELESLRREALARREVERELERLREAVRYQPPAGEPVALADVVYVDHRSWLRTLILHVGDAAPADALQPNAPVVGYDGLVGRVLTGSAGYARVQLVTDRAASVGAMVERTRRQGIARGGPAGELVLDYLPLQSDVRPGDRVVTAGIDGIYPRGLLIGTVAAVEPGDELFHRIRVNPAVDFGRLDQVFVLRPLGVPPELTEGADGAGG
ncbi:MAG TPA: rod shape-determining protein MreC [Thermoanaerobaculia bacterium]|nr:rod shape-determining protein MreC [Thermoanaerobaculia bacterium]